MEFICTCLVRDQRLLAITQQHQQIVAEMRDRYEGKLEELRSSSDGRLRGERASRPTAQYSLATDRGAFSTKLIVFLTLFCLSGVLELVDELRSNLQEAQQSSERHRSAVLLLKEQLQEVMF